jgi:hypothetical protein
MQQYLKREWEKLREHDVLFLISFSKKKQAAKKGSLYKNYIYMYDGKSVPLVFFRERLKPLSQKKNKKEPFKIIAIIP